MRLRSMWGIEPEGGTSTMGAIAIIGLVAFAFSVGVIAASRKMPSSAPCAPVNGVIVIPSATPDLTDIADGPEGARLPLWSLRNATKAIHRQGKP